MTTVTYYPENSLQFFTVPQGIHSIHVECAGSRGAHSSKLGGDGIKIDCDLAVTPGQILNIMVGDIPTDKKTASYNASDIRINGIDYNDRIIVAAGGGNASSREGYAGGALAGEPLTRVSIANDLYCPTGGTQTAGGLNGYNNGASKHGSNGSNGTLGLGGNGASGGGGAGGAGYYGGGGGGEHRGNCGGGGGGSSYVDTSLCSNVNYTANANRGFVNISYEGGLGLKFNQLYKGSQHIAYVQINGKTVKRVYKGSDLIYILGFDPVAYYPKNSLQTFNIPAGIQEVYVKCCGSKGCDAKEFGGAGGVIECYLDVTNKQKLYISVGDIPSTYNIPSYNASDIRTINADDILDINSLNSRLVVAGGGGSSASATEGAHGGAGGGEVGGTGGNGSSQNGGKGGTQSAGGAGGVASGLEPTNGNNGTFGLGGSGINRNVWSGAGGAGWYGGGSGAAARQAKSVYVGAGGGGGSSHADTSLCSDISHHQGSNDGLGYVEIYPFKPE